jgi:hypothetical protein
MFAESNNFTLGLSRVIKLSPARLFSRFQLADNDLNHEWNSANNSTKDISPDFSAA